LCAHAQRRIRTPAPDVTSSHPTTTGWPQQSTPVLRRDRSYKLRRIIRPFRDSTAYLKTLSTGFLPLSKFQNFCPASLALLTLSRLAFRNFFPSTRVVCIAPTCSSLTHPISGAMNSCRSLWWCHPRPQHPHPIPIRSPRPEWRAVQSCGARRKRRRRSTRICT
jgi:hypothetical protein